MKIIMIFLTILLLNIPNSMFAVEENDIELLETDISLITEESNQNSTTDTKYFEIVLERAGQSPWNKAVTYLVHVTPKIDSRRTQIIWDGPPSLDIRPRHPEFVDMYRDESYTFRSVVRAERPGTYNVTVNLVAWQHDTNYTNSVSDLITFDQDLLAQPLDPNYTLKVIIRILIIVLIIAISIGAIIFFGKKGFIKLKHWLTPPT